MSMLAILHPRNDRFPLLYDAATGKTLAPDIPKSTRLYATKRINWYFTSSSSPSGTLASSHKFISQDEASMKGSGDSRRQPLRAGVLECHFHDHCTDEKTCSCVQKRYIQRVPSLCPKHLCCDPNWMAWKPSVSFTLGMDQDHRQPLAGSFYA